MIIARAVLGDIANGTGRHHQSRTLMTVHPATVITQVVDSATEAALGPRTTLDPTPLWYILVRTVMWIGGSAPRFRRASLFKMN